MIYEAKKAAEEANALQRDGISILKFKSTAEKRLAEEIEREIGDLANKYLELRNHIVGFDHRRFNSEGSLYDFDVIEEHLGLSQDSLEFSRLDTQTIQKSKSEIIKNALRVVCDKLNAQTAAIFLIDKNGLLRRAGIYGWNKDGQCIEDSWFPEEYYEVGESFTGNAAANRGDIKSKYGEIQYTETLSDRDLKEESRRQYQEALGALRCAIAIPLNGRNKTYGVLRIINKTYEIGEKSFLSKESFSKEDINLLLLLSTYIANTLSNFRRDVQNKIFKFLSQLMVKPNTSQKEDTGKIYKQILDLLVLNPETAFKAAILREKNEKSGTLDVLAMSLTPDVTGSRDGKPRRPGDDGFLWLIAESKSGKPLILQNIQKEEQIQQFKNKNWIKENNFQAFGCFPLMVEGEVVGTLSLYTGYDYEFYPDSVSFLQSVTGLIASFLLRAKYEKSYVTRQVEEKFHTLANQWRQETAFSSSITQKSLHPAYQQIIGLGTAAVPLLLKELANGPDHWFWALSAITGANPVEFEQRGKIDQMRKAWLDWGKEEGMCSIKDCFPYLEDNIFSPVNIRYNCFAWAAGQDFCIWSPEPFDQYYWPPNAPKDEALDSYILAYGFIGYELSPDNNPELEPGFERIALYVNSNGKVTHATRQIIKKENIGKWTSKIGDLEDILHDTHNFLEGNDFGFSATILRRRVPLETDS